MINTILKDKNKMCLLILKQFEASNTKTLNRITKAHESAQQRLRNLCAAADTYREQASKQMASESRRFQTLRAFAQGYFLLTTKYEYHVSIHESQPRTAYS